MPRSSPPETPRGPRRVREPRIGALVDGQFVIEDRIATGGFAAIYRARDARGELVALEILHPSLGRDPSIVARFRREGAILVQLRDPHTVRTLAVGETADGTCYIAMELLAGESLHDRLVREGALRWQDAVRIARAVCCSLAEAHALGVVHRDLKPANLQVAPRRPGEQAARVKVLDFGIAKLARGCAIDDGDELTCAGQMIGTYEHMAPEQLAGGACDARSDLYALGVVLYEMLTGARPFAETAGASSPASVLAAMVTQVPRPPSIWAELPAELDRIVLRCLAREPGDRFASAIELDAALDRLLAQHDTLPEDDTVLRPSVPIVDDEGTWIEATAIVELEPEAARATGSGATGSRSSTLPGVAVAAAVRPRKARVFAVPELAEPAAPAPPQIWMWTPVPVGPHGPLAGGSTAVLPVAPSRLRWLAIAVAVTCAAAAATGVWLWP